MSRRLRWFIITQALKLSKHDAGNKGCSGVLNLKAVYLAKDAPARSMFLQVFDYGAHPNFGIP